MRVILFGTSAFAVPSLEALAAGPHRVVQCVTQPDRPQGRGRMRQPSPVKCAAARLGVPLAQPERANAYDWNEPSIDVGVVIAYGQVIGPALLARPRHGMVGVHPSLLPKYRGAAPITWALLNGETTTGITIFRLAQTVDSGEIIRQRPVPIAPDESAEVLGARLATLGAQELIRALDAIDAGRAVWRAQDAAQASLAPKVSKAQGRIYWDRPAEELARLVRALTPWPGATTHWRGRPLSIWAASAGEPRHAQHAPGTVVEVGAEQIGIATGDGVLAVTAIQLAGGRRMTVREFLAGHPVAIGEILGGGKVESGKK